MVFLPSAAAASDVCFEEPIAKELYAELQTCRQTDKEINILINKYNLETVAQDFLVDNLTSRLTLLENQIDDEHQRAERYREEWQKTGKKLVECEQSKPSRAKWFGIGAGSGLGVALLLLLL